MGSFIVRIVPAAVFALHPELSDDRADGCHQINFNVNRIEPRLYTGAAAGIRQRRGCTCYSIFNIFHRPDRTELREITKRSVYV